MTYCDATLLSASSDVPPTTACVSPHDIDVILPDDAPSSAAQMIVDLFLSANDLVPEAPYRVTVRRLRSELPDQPRHWNRRTVILLGQIQKRWPLGTEESRKVSQILRLSTRTVLIGGAVFLLCETGQQHQQTVAIHPNFHAAASEEGLVEDTPGGHFALCGRVSSAISSFAALRLAIELIGHDHGRFIATALTDYIGLSADATRTQSKVCLGLRQRARGDRLIDNCLTLMQAHIEEPLKIGDLARKQGVSTRKLQRRFLEKTGTGPLTAYRALRIERAQQLLVHTSLSLSEIIVATGFGTHSNLARWFRREYGVSPLTLRRQAFAGQGQSAVA